MTKHERAAAISAKTGADLKVDKLTRLYKNARVKNKKILVRRCWRRPDDEKNKRKDERMMYELQEGLKRCLA